MTNLMLFIHKWCRENNTNLWQQLNKKKKVYYKKYQLLKFSI